MNLYDYKSSIEQIKVKTLVETLYIVLIPECFVLFGVCNNTVHTLVMNKQS